MARLAILGLPTFALALAIITVTTYLPVIASGFAASTVVIGVLIGGEVRLQGGAIGDRVAQGAHGLARGCARGALLLGDARPEQAGRS